MFTLFLRVEGMKGLLVDPYTGPHAIIKRLNDRNFVIDIDGRHVNVGIKRLRPAYLPNPELAGEPPLSTSTLPQGSSQSPGSTSTVTDNPGTSRDDSVRRESRETKAQPSPSVEQTKAEHNYAKFSQDQKRAPKTQSTSIDGSSPTLSKASKPTCTRRKKRVTFDPKITKD